MGDGRARPERRRNAGAASSRPRQSPVNLLILTVIAGLVATTAASVIMGGGVDDGTPHGRLLGVLERVGDAQEAHHEATGRFTPWTTPLDVAVPEGLEVTVVRGDALGWEALATDRGLGLSCLQRGRWEGSGGVREPPACFTNRP
jgi:hypothetical protein